MEHSLDLPPYATNATVFLNGWRVKYLGTDHHVAGIGTTIENIRMERNTLKWQAAGVLLEEEFDEAYSWCYYYTVVAWNPSNLDLTVDQEGGSCPSGDLSDANAFGAPNIGTTTALASFPSFLKNPGFTGGKTVAILPRGFGFAFGEACEPEDHHLLQIGYNLDHSEVIIESGKGYKKGSDNVPAPLAGTASHVDSGFVSWETSAIFKDNKGRRDYTFGEVVSGLSGSDVGIIQMPFSVLPREGSSTCAAVGAGPEPQQFRIEKVPFEFAVPMLTGWELGYLCADEHIKEGGIWIDDWGYDKSAQTLRYTLSSTLRDKDDDPIHYRSHKITILGLRPLSGGVVPLERMPDLVPSSPSGDSAAAFCRLEQDRRQLRVTVKNQGNENAPASKTSVIFGSTTLTLDTPPIPAGDAADLLFKVPTNCFSPNCSFKITVDSSNQVNESSKEVNNSVSGGCIG